MNTAVLKEYSYNGTPEQVWKAITDKNEMGKWYFHLEKFIPEIGFEFHFWGGTEERQYLHNCRITEVIQGKKLCHTWSYEGIPGETILCFEIESEGAKRTKLTLSHSGFETFPADNPDLDPKNFDEGWTYILGTSLREYLEKNS